MIQTWRAGFLEDRFKLICRFKNGGVERQKNPRLKSPCFESGSKEERNSYPNKEGWERLFLRSVIFEQKFFSRPDASKTFFKKNAAFFAYHTFFVTTLAHYNLV
jgi:hypothetical protein